MAVPVPAIISQDMFETAQQRLDRNVHMARRHNTTYEYLLRGLVSRGLPLPRTWTSLAHRDMSPCFCRGRYEGTEMFLGRREPTPALGHRHGDGGSPSIRVWGSHERRTSRAKPSQNTLPEEDGARTYTAEKKQKIRSSGAFVS
jgi:hypothetical protein